MFARLMGLRTMSPARLHQALRSGDATPIDVNSRQSWLEARVPGARNLDPLGFDERDLPADKAAVLVFYCSNPLCRKAPNAARRAEDMGYQKVYVMSAGISGWRRAALPVDSGDTAAGRA